MPKWLGVSRLRSAFVSLFGPRQEQAREKPAPENPPRVRLWALVQTRPQAIVLAVSNSRENLEAELTEINDTWNRDDLRTQLQHYEIQSVCLLQTGLDPARRVVEGPTADRA